MNCPHCGEKCKVVSYKEITGGREIYDAFYKSEPRDISRLKPNREISYYYRTRWCENCKEIFSTAELEEKYVSELIDLRNRVDYLEDFASKVMSTLTTEAKFISRFIELQVKEKEIAKKLHDDYQLEVGNVLDPNFFNSRHFDKFFHHFWGYYDINNIILASHHNINPILERIIEYKGGSPKSKELAKLILEYLRLDMEIKKLVRVGAL